MDSNPLSRRQFFALSGGAVALLLTAYHTLRQAGRYEPGPGGFELLTAKEAAIFRVLGEFLVPSGVGLPGSAGDDETLRRIDRFLLGAPPPRRRLLRALPLVFEHGTALDRFGARRLTALPAARLEGYLTEWAESEEPVQAQLWVALKTAYGLSYFERPDVLTALGCPVGCGGGA